MITTPSQLREAEGQGIQTTLRENAEIGKRVEAPPNQQRPTGGRKIPAACHGNAPWWGRRTGSIEEPPVSKPTTSREQRVGRDS